MPKEAPRVWTAADAAGDLPAPSGRRVYHLSSGAGDPTGGDVPTRFEIFFGVVVQLVYWTEHRRR
jgi:hypothetical protein